MFTTIPFARPSLQDQELQQPTILKAKIAASNDDDAVATITFTAIQL